MEENLVDLGSNIQTGEYAPPQKIKYPTLSFDDFFQRPVEIDKIRMMDGSSLDRRLRVWNLWSLVQSVRAKLKQYAWLRTDLEITIKVTGTNFHSGRLLASYQPYDQRNATLIHHLNSLLAVPAWRPLVLNYLSQAHDARVINVNSRSETVMTLPFISTKMAHRLYNASGTAVGSLTSLEDFESAGSLFLYTVNDIEVSSGTSDVYVQVYARAVNYEFGPPTGTQLALVTESKVTDERKTGPVERITSRMAAIAGLLVKAPVIGTYAYASHIALGAISKVSSIFGFSRPVKEENHIYVKPDPFSGDAVCIGSTVPRVISVDPKRELSVSPSVVASSCDETAISYLGSKETLLTTFEWAQADTPMDTVLFQARVTPQLDTIYFGVSEEFHQPTAMSYAVLPFTWWRGSVHFRFEVVASKFHCGSLFVGHEPNTYQAALVLANLTTNKLNARIWDISATQSSDYCVNWTQSRPWKRVMDPANVSANFGNVDFTTDVDDTNNGVIVVTPFTALTGNDASAVRVNVYVSCPDLAVQVPTPTYMPTDRSLVTESKVYMEEKRAEQTMNEVDYTCISLTPYFNPGEMLYSDFFGEAIASLSVLTKRFQSTGFTIVDSEAGALYTLRFEGPILPPPYPTYGSTTNIIDPHIIGYMRYAYLGYRGSVQKRLHMNATADMSRLATTSCELLPPTSSELSFGSVSSSTRPILRSLRGTVVTVPSTNAGQDFELPWYCPNLFVFSCNDDLVGDNADGDMDPRWYRNYRWSVEMGSTLDDYDSDESSALGEDGRFMYFLGAPFFRIAT